MGKGLFKKDSAKKIFRLVCNVGKLLRLSESMKDISGEEVIAKITDYRYDKNGNQFLEEAYYIRPAESDSEEAYAASAYSEETEETDGSLEITSNVFDGFNRLKATESIKAGGRALTEFTYNGDDLRVSKTVRSPGSQPETTEYLYDGQHVVLETDGAGSVKARYVRGINYIARLDSSNEASYLMYNGHGDVVQTVNEAGEVQNSYDYDIWGNPTLTVEEYACAIRYAGEFMDAETGLYYLRARYYDPYVGRFISEDSSPLSLNRYTYCENDPVNYIDPTGHLKQGDEKLTQSAQLRIMELTKQWYAASTQAEKQKITNQANAIRNESGNIAKVSESSHNSSFYSGFSSSTSDGSSMSKSEWNSIANNFYIQGSVSVDKGVSISSINVKSGTTASISNSGSIASIITGTQSMAGIINYGSIGSITTGIGSSTVIKNSGTIEKVSAGKGSSTSISNTGTMFITQIGEGGTANIQNNGYMFNIEINNPTGFDLGADTRMSGILGIAIGGSGSIGRVRAILGDSETNFLSYDLGSMLNGEFNHAYNLEFVSSGLSAQEVDLRKIGFQFSEDVIKSDSRFKSMKIGFDGKNVTINGKPIGIIGSTTTLNGRVYASEGNIQAAMESYWTKYGDGVLKKDANYDFDNYPSPAAIQRAYFGVYNDNNFASGVYDVFPNILKSKMDQWANENQALLESDLDLYNTKYADRVLDYLYAYKNNQALFDNVDEAFNSDSPAVILAAAILFGGGVSNSGVPKYGKLKSIGKGEWQSTEGLIYSQGSKQGNRINHVLEHASPNPNKLTHTVFNVPKKQILGLVDEAWSMKGRPEVNDPQAYVVNMGRIIGTNGETKIKIVVAKPGSNYISTAYPIR